MAFADDLLGQARTLATIDKAKPKQANLRRAISSAYYALFHLLTCEGAALVGGRLSAIGRAKVSRAFAHTEMKAACASYCGGASSNSFNAHVGPLLKFPISAELQSLARAFVELQQARHRADYDMSIRWARQQTLAIVDVAVRAVSAWRAIRHQSNAKVFLLDLLLRKSWSKL